MGLGMQMRTECDVLTRKRAHRLQTNQTHPKRIDLGPAEPGDGLRDRGAADGTPTSPHHTPPPRLGARDRDAPAAAPPTAGRAPPRPSALLAPRTAPPAPETGARPSAPDRRPRRAAALSRRRHEPRLMAAGGGRRRGASVGPSGGGGGEGRERSRRGAAGERRAAALSGPTLARRVSLPSREERGADRAQVEAVASSAYARPRSPCRRASRAALAAPTGGDRSPGPPGGTPRQSRQRFFGRRLGPHRRRQRPSAQRLRRRGPAPRDDNALRSGETRRRPPERRAGAPAHR
mmetsp:Transcript_27912/g.82103  ORF Transcript_27912/g.82103 Transcript_27912/m.82103 type:complete len:291 (-) Transcript_27912:474-1346(-)